MLQQLGERRVMQGHHLNVRLLPLPLEQSVFEKWNV